MYLSVSTVTTLLMLLPGGVRLEDTADPVVTVLQGKMRGTKMTSRNGRSFYAFLGIPYATPPVGPLRFQVSIIIMIIIIIIIIIIESTVPSRNIGCL